MKKIFKYFCFAIVFSLMIPSVLSEASFDDYSDVSGHWAETALRQAYCDGLIEGYNGHLLPDDSITGAQALAILCRVLGAEKTADISGMGLPADKWYYDYAAKAVYLGLISTVEKTFLDAPISRQDAFYMIAEAFQLIEIDPDMSASEQFSDFGLVKIENRRALASLISQGLVSGYSGKLDVNDNMTRASFLSMVYRIINGFIPAAAANGRYMGAAMLQGPAELSGVEFGHHIWFDCAASGISLDSVVAGCAVIRSHSLDTLTIGGSTHISRLVLATQSGAITVSPSGEAVVDTLVIGAGNGAVTVEGVGVIEVTGNNRRITVTGSVKSVVVSGRNNTICVREDAKVGKVELMMSAYGSSVVSDGIVSELNVRNIKAAISGGGSVDMLRLFRADTEFNVIPGKLMDSFDIGLTGASLELHAPSTLPAGETLNISAAVANAAHGMVCGLTWYIDGIPVSEATMTTDGSIPLLIHEFEYSRDIAATVEIKAVVRYVTKFGEQQELSAMCTVALENYDKLYWMSLDAPDVLEKVTLGYQGDFTLDWALANDLDDYDKEVWINAKGYESDTDYLLWVNLAHQRVNIFERSGGGWDLIRTCLAGTGAPGRGTPPGVWTTSFKQLDGWTTAAYTVKPVVRFMGSIGYAFHSRLYYPGTTTIQNPGIGYPISNGCVRMYDEDIWFIYDNIPGGTTVVVF